MVAPVSVMTQGDFMKWVGQQTKITPPSTTTHTTSTTTPTTTGTPTTTTGTSVTSTSTTPSAAFQTLAASGKTVYSSSCAVCHGNNGQGGIGPPLWGTNATLGQYAGTNLFNSNAQDMLNFISTVMPLNAPGSLSHEQYIDVLSYILVQNNLVSPSAAFNESQLGQITLK